MSSFLVKQCYIVLHIRKILYKKCTDIEDTAIKDKTSLDMY